ncbi:MAG: hypothetical protein KatS3mg081_0545 [Gemmatimonadales bacterium]|nr:MAG: hypothetical protein KatS3mg081_0545 [Gemmatimonadales bacterium]
MRRGRIVTVYMPQKLADAIKTVAEATDRSPSSVVRTAVARHLGLETTSRKGEQNADE